MALSCIHTVNIIMLFTVIYIFMHYGSNSGSHLDKTSQPQSFLNSWEQYGWFVIVLYVCQYLTILGLPQAVFNFLGFVLFDPFPENPKIEVFISIGIF